MPPTCDIPRKDVQPDPDVPDVSSPPPPLVDGQSKVSVSMVKTTKGMAGHSMGVDRAGAGVGGAKGCSRLLGGQGGGVGVVGEVGKANPTCKRSTIADIVLKKVV